MARVPKIQDTRHSTLSHTTVFILWRICANTHTYIWMGRDCIWITVATKQHSEWNIFILIGSHAKCWLYIFILIGSHAKCWLYIFILIGSHAKCWLYIFHCEWRNGGDWANTWHWTKRFTIFFSNRISSSPQLLPNFLPYHILRPGLY